jgi:hypothetical protein
MITRSESNSNGGARDSMRAAVEHLNRRAAACPPYGVLARARLLLRKPHVFPRIHLEIQDQRILRVGLDHFLHEFHVNRVFAEDGIFVHRLEIDGDKERPVDFRVDSLAALDAQDLWDFEELHPRVHHHLLHAGWGYLVLQSVENDMVNHEGKANRRFHCCVQVQSALSDAPIVATAREAPKPSRH